MQNQQPTDIVPCVCKECGDDFEAEEGTDICADCEEELKIQAELDDAWDRKHRADEFDHHDLDD